MARKDRQRRSDAGPLRRETTAQQWGMAKQQHALRAKLNNISEIRRFFHRNDHPIYFISATNFNLLGIDE